ncbi:MAG TPA: hypothetical protein VF167_09485 [Longimicrobiaceae bacterium]
MADGPRTTVTTTADWTWLLRVPVPQDGDPIPFELWMLYHANTLLPMRQQEAPHG